MKNNNAFLEDAEVFGNYYGTPKDMVDDNLSKGNNILFDIDWQGARQLVLNDVYDIISIFILPPSIEELKSRLENRAEDSAETVAYRMNKSKDEISHYNEYDFVFVNHNLEETYSKIKTIIDYKKLANQDFNTIIEFVEQKLLQ